MEYNLTAKYSTYFNVFSKLLEAKIKRRKIPIMVEFQVNKECNLKCSYCYAQLETLNKNINFSTQEIKNIIDELYGMGMRVIRILGGEPLIREDLGEIIRYLRKRNVFIELSTNGVLLKSKARDLKELNLLDTLQISIDGNEASTDIVRGNGTYKKIIEGIEEAIKYHLPVRLHGVYNKFSIEASQESPVEHLLKLSKKYCVPFNFCQYVSSVDGSKDAAYIEHKEIMRKGFYQQCWDFKLKGHRFFNSFDALNQIMHWPNQDKEFLFQRDSIPNYFTRCMGGELYCFIDSDGSMYPCVPLWKKGLNIRDAGIKKAWDFTNKVRSQVKCFSCVSMGDIEFSKTMCLSPKVILNTLKQVLGLNRHSKNLP